jgi:hypothetical protein
MWTRADGDDIQEMDRGSIQEVDGGVEEVGELLLLLPRECGMDPYAGIIFLAASRVDERGRRRGRPSRADLLCAPLAQGARAAEGPPSVMDHTTAGLQTTARDGEDGRGGWTRGRT